MDYISPVLIFSLSILFWRLFIILGKNYALDIPNNRKQHKSKIPQIGGLIFGLIILLIAWLFKLAPDWYLIGGLVTIILGATDDRIDVPWGIKIVVQLILLFYIYSIFADSFLNLSFYNSRHLLILNYIHYN